MIYGFGIQTAASGGGGGGTVMSVSGGATGLSFTNATTTPTLGGGPLGVAYGGTGTTTVFTAASVIFAGTAGVYSQNNANFNWSNTNRTLTIRSAVDLGIISAGQIVVESNTGFLCHLLATGSGLKTCFRIESNAGGLYQAIMVNEATAEIRYFAASGGYYPSFYENGVESMRLFNGNVGIGETNPTSKLQVKGDIMTQDPGNSNGAGRIKMGIALPPSLVLTLDTENYWEVSIENVIRKVAFVVES